MAHVATAPSSALTAEAPPSYMQWGPVFAGGLMAAALSFVLLTFGSAIGFSVTSPWENSGLSAKTTGAIAVFWTIAQQIAAFLVGGYVAGRMRTRWTEARPDEVEFRDGLHGGLVWAVGVVFGAALILSTVGSAVRTGTEVVGKVASTAVANADPLSYQVDVLLRPANQGGGAGVAAPAAQPPATGATTDPRPEITRIMARSLATGTLTDTDRIYLTGLIAQRTGVPPQEIDQRVRSTYAEAQRIAKDTADKARRTAMLAGFVTAAALLISLAAAWWAAVRGGHHRDNAVPARIFARRIP